jgi:hypothetical protein
MYIISAQFPVYMKLKSNAYQLSPERLFVQVRQLIHSLLFNYLENSNTYRKGLFCDSSKFGHRFKTLYNKFKRGRVSNKWWGADHSLLATDTLASLVDMLALITRHISFLRGGRPAATVNVSKFRRDILCLCSK